jgi:hypothetical protein
MVDLPVFVSYQTFDTNEKRIAVFRRWRTGIIDDSGRYVFDYDMARNFHKLYRMRYAGAVYSIVDYAWNKYADNAEIHEKHLRRLVKQGLLTEDYNLTMDAIIIYNTAFDNHYKYLKQIP